MGKTLVSSFTSLHHLSKEQGVYEQIRHAIISGEISAGQRLISAEIGEQLGVSSMPVRNALMRLEAEGLVTRIPHREFVVTPYTSRDVRELYAVRAELDSFAGRLAAANASPKQLEGLRELLAQAEAALASDDLVSLRRINREFHTALATCSGNRHLLEVIQLLQARIPSYHGDYYAMPGLAQKSVEDHRLIVDALSQGNGDLVGSLIRQDMQNTGQILSRIVQKCEANGGGAESSPDR